MFPKNDTLVGKTLGRYTLTRLIAKGGMGRVYEGVDAKLNRRVAVKVITLDEDRASELMERFAREARAISRLDNHPNIVTIYEYDEDKDTGVHYLAMQYIEGQSLAEYFEALAKDNKRIPVDEMLDILRQIAEALDHAHDRGVVHRDIKPANIMLQEENSGRRKATLMDFGLVMQLDTSSTLGSAFGTPRYIAPEQAVSSHQAGPTSDIYSLGVVVYELLTGKPPFSDEDTPMSVALSHITKPPPSPKLLRPDLPDEVVQVIMRALEKKPEDRYQRASEFVAALADAYKGISPTLPDKNLRTTAPAVPAPKASTSLSSSSSSDKPSSGRLVTIGVVLLVLVVLIGGLVFLVTSGGGDDDGGDEETVTENGDSATEEAPVIADETEEAADEPTEVAAVAPTEATEEPTSTPEPTDPPTDAPTATSAPTEATEEATAVPEAGDATEESAAPVAGTTGGGRLEFYYFGNALILRNPSQTALDLSEVALRGENGNSLAFSTFSNRTEIANWEGTHCAYFYRANFNEEVDFPLSCQTDNIYTRFEFGNASFIAWANPNRSTQVAFEVYLGETLLGTCTPVSGDTTPSSACVVEGIPLAGN